jgi:hypothetical protein
VASGPEQVVGSVHFGAAAINQSTATCSDCRYNSGAVVQIIFFYAISNHIPTIKDSFFTVKKNKTFIWIRYFQFFSLWILLRKKIQLHITSVLDPQ